MRRNDVKHCPAWAAVTLAVALVVTATAWWTACGDDSGGGGNDNDAAPPTDASGTDGTVDPDGGGTDCAEGMITSACLCGGQSASVGYCCRNIWFDPHYGSLSNGCPSGNFYFVNRNHPQADDGNPGTEDEPWATIERAAWGSNDRNQPDTARALQPGDVAIVVEGTYVAQGASGERWDPWWNAANSGTSGNPIVFKARGDVFLESAAEHFGTAQSATATTIVLADDASSVDEFYSAFTIKITGGTGAGQVRYIHGTPSYVGATRTATISTEAGQEWDTNPDSTSTYEVRRRGALIGSTGRDNIVWDGFKIDTRNFGYPSDTGPAVLFGPTGCAFLGLEIIGHTNCHADNFNGIRVEGATDTLVANNVIHGIRRFDGSHNGAGIMLYADVDIVMENNDFYDCDCAIFSKGNDNTNVTIRYNRFWDNTKAIRTSYSINVQAYQNIATNCGMGIQIADYTSDSFFVNNTIDGSTNGIWVRWPDSWQNITVSNNIITNCETAVNSEEQNTIPNAAFDYQDYFGFTQFRFDWNDITFNDWTTQTGFDGNSITADPDYVDGANGNFRLNAGSPAENAGVDILDLDGDGDTTDPVNLGAYLTGAEQIGAL